MIVNNEALAFAKHAPMLSRTHPRSANDGGCACCNPEPTGKARIAARRAAKRRKHQELKRAIRNNDN
jgi:hypothetical protein